MICSDEEWIRLTDSQRKQLGLTNDKDGEFYMNFNRDFLRYFGEVTIVHKTPMKDNPGSDVKSKQTITLKTARTTYKLCI